MRYLRNILTFAICTFIMLSYACKVQYSFTGVSVDPNVKSFSVETFPNLAGIVNANLSQTITEKMKDKFSSEARLDIVDSSGDVEFSGAVLNYFVGPAASAANDRAAQNRLTVSVKVEYVNNVTAEKWNNTFQHFENFDSDVNLNDVEDQLVEEITDRIVTDIFNKAFSNW